MTDNPTTAADRLILCNQALILTALSAIVSGTSPALRDLLIGQAERTQGLVEQAEAAS